MQWMLPNLLAASDPTAAIIFFLIWGLIAIATQYQKWQEKRRKAAPPPPPPVPQHRPAGARPDPQHTGLTAPAYRPKPTPQAAKVNPRPKLQQPPPRRLPPLRPVPGVRPAPRPPAIPPAKLIPQQAPAAVEAASLSDARMRQEVGSAQAAAAAKAGQDRPAITATELHRILRPNSLRRAFILTELLQPPLALRETDRS